MLKKFIFAFIGLGVVFGAIVAVKMKQFEPPPPFEFPPEAVTTAVAEAQTWERTQHAVGSMRADQGVVVSSEGQGAVRRIGFESGSVVSKGDILIELDTEVERAQLAAAEARSDLAKINLDRARDLWGRNAVAKSEYDAADAASKQAIADVNSIKATIDKKIMRAPFTGRTGIRLVNLGQFVDRGEPIVSLQSLDPIHADFSLPQQRISDVGNGFLVRITTDARPGQVFEGKVTAVNPEIDAATRTVKIQATFANRGEQLSPGMFVNVSVIAPEKNDVVAVPATAVYYQPFGDSIFVAKEEKDANTGQTVKRAEQRFVRLGEKRGDFVAIVAGVNAGEEVVTSGVFKLSNGSKLMVDNSIAPKPELAPTPKNS